MLHVTRFPHEAEFLKCFRSQIFIAQGCGDADMCEVTDTCAEIELNNFVLKNNANPCAMTPVCVILSKTKRRYGVPRTKNDVGMNHLFPDILPVFCSTFNWLWSLGCVLFLRRLFGLA